LEILFPTIPEWFLTSEAKGEKKPIELVKCINTGLTIGTAQRSLTEFILVERIAAGVYSHDLIRCEHEDETVIWYFGVWNDGVL